MTGLRWLKLNKTNLSLVPPEIGKLKKLVGCCVGGIFPWFCYIGADKQTFKLNIVIISFMNNHAKLHPV